MNKLLIANWKMQLSHNETIAWIENELTGVLETLEQTENELVICPSFTALSYALEVYPSGAWGAQSCGPALKGAYTGDVSARSLKELGVTYTLVGHSEQRRYHGETDAVVADKVALLIQEEIQPIICIGETEDQRPLKNQILTKQLERILPLYARIEAPLIIAYEPVWSIGTGITPTPNELDDTLDFLEELCETVEPYLLYGGSIGEKNIQELSPLVDGFLIGSASLNSELLKKIILSC